MDPTEQEARQLLERLSRQEWEVFRRHCQGMSYAAIGRELYVGKSTVQNYMERAYDKLNLRDIYDKQERQRLIREIFAPALLSYSEPTALQLSEPEPQRQIVPTSQEVQLMVRDDEGMAGPITIVAPYNRSIEPIRPASKEIIVPPSKKVRRWPAFLAGVVLTVLVLGAVSAWLYTSGRLPLAAASLPPVEVTREVTIEVTKVLERTIEVSTTPPSTYTPQPTPPPVILVATATDGPTATPVIVTATPEPTKEGLLGVDTATPEPATATPTTNTAGAPVAGTVLFSDTFDTGPSSAWIVESGDWNMRNGKLVNTGPRGIIWLGKKDWTDVAVEFDVDNTYCNGFFDILIRMQDLDNYVGYTAVGCNSEKVYLVKDGKYVKDIVFTYSTPGRHKFEVKGNIYRVFQNGKLVGSGSDDSFSSGSVGILMEGAAQQLDNFKVSVP